MKMMFLAAGAVVAFAASPVFAQTAPPASDPAMTSGAAPQSDPAKASAAAETGTAANTAATATDLKVGAAVSDSAGASVGTISKVGKGSGGDTMVTLKADGKTKTVPASSLSLSGGSLVSSQTTADIWGPQ